ncbi:MAG: hypothetical protein HY721_29805 [Planctomycetes bacterium]|nr:hypothetical protein [Planctomycetota bacterium]
MAKSKFGCLKRPSSSSTRSMARRYVPRLADLHSSLRAGLRSMPRRSHGSELTSQMLEHKRSMLENERENLRRALRRNQRRRELNSEMAARLRKRLGGSAKACRRKGRASLPSWPEKTWTMMRIER